MDRTQILNDLDKHAAEFNFPVLDNAYVEYAAARLSGFRGTQDWLIVFEVIGFAVRQIEFVNTIYGFGSCLEVEGVMGEEVPVVSIPEHPLFDSESNECVANWGGWSAGVSGRKMSFSPTRDEYAAAGIVIAGPPGNGTLREIELLRFLVYRLGKERLFMNDEDLLGRFPKCKNLDKFVQTTEWEHPDIARQERPSQNVAIRSLVEALFNKDSSLFNPGIANTHWSHWAQAKGAP